ncbi:uncharacterized protein si:ch211-199g17.2 [Mugil cephalus]|uniref:uncharacterized protein si:ch211-199g17.2 n=1 Tax=Mugil cephalus TaxID=48193 RepID=UPI001FB7B758|nr:uncharacterized protein si:ch211-199g17.2 [Mugil cephalus]
MQPGVSNKSQLFDSLKAYLNNKKRLQPIIGLSSIVECVKVGRQNREALYFCEVCVCRLSRVDMRNHIAGSLHRFNYIKARHQHLVSEWQEDSDLSKLAWPLMEMAKVLEAREGAGDVQLFEVDDGVYQRMATRSENDAVTLINFLRDGQSESHPEPIATSSQSQRIVLLAQNQQRWSEKPLKADIKPFSFLDDYTGTKPLIGLVRVVECRSEDGSSYCFLCHCCRIRSNKKDIVDHLTSSSHLVNYLMETRPEQVELMTEADNKANEPLLQSLAKNVEQEEGRGQLKVVKAPESLCALLTGKSYHWCIKMLCDGSANTNIPKKRMAVKEPSVNETSVRVTSSNMRPRLTRNQKKRNARAKSTVFSVSLPLNRRTLLLERASFSMGGFPVSPGPPSPNSESQLVDFELDCDTGSLAANKTECAPASKTSQLQRYRYSDDAGDGQYVPEKNLRVTLFQDVNGCVRSTDQLSQSEDITGTKDHEVQGEMNDTRKYSSQEIKTWRNEDLQTQNEDLLPTQCHSQDWSSYNKAFYTYEEGCTEQWFNSTAKTDVGTTVEESREESHGVMSSDAVQHYNQQHLHNQYMPSNNTSSLTGAVGNHGLSGELLTNLNGVRMNIQTHPGGPLAQSGSVIFQPGAHSHTVYPSDHVQTASQSYWTQFTAYQADQVVSGYPSIPSHNTGSCTGQGFSWMNPDQNYPYSVGTRTESTAYSQPEQALYYAANSNLNF